MANNAPITKDDLEGLKELIDEKIGRVCDQIEAHIKEETGYRRTLEERIEALNKVVESQAELIASANREVQELKQLVERYKGALGVLTLLGSCFLVIITIFKDRIAAFFR